MPPSKPLRPHSEPRPILNSYLIKSFYCLLITCRNSWIRAVQPVTTIFRWNKPRVDMWSCTYICEPQILRGITSDPTKRVARLTRIESLGCRFKVNMHTSYGYLYVYIIRRFLVLGRRRLYRRYLEFNIFLLQCQRM